MIRKSREKCSSIHTISESAISEYKNRWGELHLQLSPTVPYRFVWNPQSQRCPYYVLSWHGGWSLMMIKNAEEYRLSHPSAFLFLCECCCLGWTGTYPSLCRWKRAHRAPMAYFAPDPMETDVRLAPGGVHDSRPVAQNIGTQRSSIGIKSNTISKSGTAVRGQKTCLSAGAYGSHPYGRTSFTPVPPRFSSPISWAFPQNRISQKSIFRNFFDWKVANMGS